MHFSFAKYEQNSIDEKSEKEQNQTISLLGGKPKVYQYKFESNIILKYS